MRFVFLFLTYFTLTDSRSIHITKNDPMSFLFMAYDPEIPPLGIYPEKTIIPKDTCIPMFTAALSTIVRTWRQPRCPLTDE